MCYLRHMKIVLWTDSTGFLVDGHGLLKLLESAFRHASEANEYSKTEIRTDAMH
jgi:hypothetical protein